MKKSILVLAMLVMFSSSATFISDPKGDFTIKYQTMKIEGMNYLVVYSKYSYSSQSTATALQVINVTKDKLEVEKLRAQKKGNW